MKQSQQTISNFINEQGQSIAADLLQEVNNGNKINIDDVYWQSLYAVDEIKLLIADKVFKELEKKHIIINR